MKRIQLAIIAPLILSWSVAAQTQANLEKDPAYLPIDKVFDLTLITPQVSVNLPRFLLMDAISGLDLGTDDPFAAAGTSLKELFQDIKLIRFLVIETNEKSKPRVDEGVAALKKQLQSGWLPIVSVPAENVGVYVIPDPTGEQIAGVALLVYNDGDAVIGNVVGKVSIGQLLKVALQMKGHDAGSFLPKDLLKKLSELSSQTKPETQEPKEPKQAPEAKEAKEEK